MVASKAGLSFVPRAELLARMSSVKKTPHSRRASAVPLPFAFLRQTSSCCTEIFAPLYPGTRSTSNSLDVPQF